MIDHVALDNEKGQQILRSLGFEENTDRLDVCMMFMTKQMFIAKYGRSKLLQGISWRRSLS